MELGVLISALIVWNVGQGQWVTELSPDVCRHYDVGGEFLPWTEVSELCSKKKNEIYISHWDQDHISGLKNFRWSTLPFCRGTQSDFPAPKDIKWFEALPQCHDETLHLLRPFWTEKDLLKKRPRNESSLVVQGSDFLAPGDSTTRMEKKWTHSGNFHSESVRILVLGHHGSRGSTSPELLKSLSHLKMAVSSARQAVYGHPHQEVRNRLKQAHVSLLRTEDWGNLIFLY